MRKFTDLYTALDETNKTNQKIAALVEYFKAAPPEDAAWAVYFLSGGRPKRLINVRKLVGWAIEMADVPEWLFGESYEAVGDLGETIALLLPENTEGSTLPLHRWVEDRLLKLYDMNEEQQHAAMIEWWGELDSRQRLVLNKLITGAFRIGVSQRLMTRALSQVSGIDAGVVAHRLMGAWEPTAQFFKHLIASETHDADISRPYPFFLAYPVDSDLATLGDIADWQIEWKWDGIRSQLVRREGQSFLWSRGEDLITDRFPEVTEASASLPDGTVLDGELLPWKNDTVMPFAQLQRRIGRKDLGKRILSDVPVIFLAYDVIEGEGVDIREWPLSKRRELLARIIGEAGQTSLLLSPTVEAKSWEWMAELHAESRARNVEGFMIKRKDSPYRVGRQRGDWWKWKIEPYTVDAVLIYAQRGSGRRASLYTDYTFAVWDSGELVPFAKAYSGLTDAEIRQVDQFVRNNTIERFGPVHSVKPQLVFELGFEGIQQSKRHKSGIAVRFPRMLRWRHDLKAEQANTIEMVRALLPEAEEAG
jgi:DNA ligase 1